MPPPYKFSLCYYFVLPISEHCNTGLKAGLGFQGQLCVMTVSTASDAGSVKPAFSLSLNLSLSLNSFTATTQKHIIPRFCSGRKKKIIERQKRIPFLDAGLSTGTIYSNQIKIFSLSQNSVPFRNSTNWPGKLVKF